MSAYKKKKTRYWNNLSDFDQEAFAQFSVDS